MMMISNSITIFLLRKFYSYTNKIALLKDDITKVHANAIVAGRRRG